jgi:5-methylcytosine-specific restriction enzyme A
MARLGFRQRGYDGRWDPVAREFRASHPLCLGCWAVGLETPTEMVDHVKPLAGDRDGLLDPGNLQPSCRWHHDNVKRTLELQWKLNQLPESALRLDSPRRN